MYIVWLHLSLTLTCELELHDYVSALLSEWQHLWHWVNLSNVPAGASEAEAGRESGGVSIYSDVFAQSTHCIGMQWYNNSWFLACSAYTCHLFTPCYSISFSEYQYYRFIEFDLTPFRFADKFFLRNLLINHILLIQDHSHIIAAEDSPHTWILNHHVGCLVANHLHTQN